MGINFIGLGKLGLPLATCFAKNKIKVTAIDKNKDLINLLSQGKKPWTEKNLQQNITEASPYIDYTLDYSNCINNDTSIILVNTPSVKKDGSFSNLYVEQSLKSICDELVKAKKSTHHFILSSTVMPRSIKDTFIPLIESITGWDYSKGEFGFSYVPDFVAIGQIISDFENPDFLLIGSSSKKYATKAESLYKKIIKNNAPVSKLNLAEAELCKVSLNAYITTKISFANYLGLLSKKVDPSINVDNITKTIGQDKRIGTKYFTAGTSYGGTCFPRDTWAFIKVSEKVGMRALQMEANETINDLTDQDIILNLIAQDASSVGLIGLSFKPGTSVITESLAYKLTKKLSKYNIDIYAFDYAQETINNFTQEFPEVNVSKNFDTINANSDILIYCVNDDIYTQYKTSKEIIDPWRIIK